MVTLYNYGMVCHVHIVRIILRIIIRGWGSPI